MRHSSTTTGCPGIGKEVLPRPRKRLMRSTTAQSAPAHGALRDWQKAAPGCVFLCWLGFVQCNSRRPCAVWLLTCACWRQSLVEQANNVGSRSEVRMSCVRLHRNAVWQHMCLIIFDLLRTYRDQNALKVLRKLATQTIKEITCRELD